MLFDTSPGLHLNTTQAWDAIKEARKSIGTKGDVDVGQNVVAEIRDYHPVQFGKARIFLKLMAHHYGKNWDPDEHICSCVFWMPGLRAHADKQRLDAGSIAKKTHLSVNAVQSLIENYRGSLEVTRVIAELLFPDGDPDAYISTELPVSLRSQVLAEGKMSVKKVPNGYAFTAEDLNVIPKKKAPWDKA